MNSEKNVKKNFPTPTIQLITNEKGVYPYKKLIKINNENRPEAIFR